MNRRDIERLIGGYATGTLTPEEEQALFAAALEDQQLFDALAHEQPLRDLLRDPAARASLLAACTLDRVPWYRRFARPLVAVAALACIAVTVGVWQTRRPKPQPVLTAEVTAPVRQSAPPKEPGTSAPAANAPAKPIAPPPSAAPPVAAPRSLARELPRRMESKVRPAPAPAPPAADAVKQMEVSAGAAAPVLAEAPKIFNGTLQNAQVAGELGEKLKAVPPSNSFLPAPAARNAKAILDAAAPVFATALPQVKWTLLRQQPDGQYAAADPADLDAGDTVKLRLEAPEPGYVTVSQAGQRVLSPIEPGKPFEMTIQQQNAGTREIEFWFVRRPAIAPAAAGAPSTTGAPAVNVPHPPSTRITLTYR